MQIYIINVLIICVTFLSVQSAYLCLFMSMSNGTFLIGIFKNMFYN